MTLQAIERARTALWSIPPDISREEWVRAGMAAHAAGLTFEDFNDWSAGATSYEAAAARDTWGSFKAGKGIGPGTLFRIAAEHGESMEAPAKPQRKTAVKAGSRAPGVMPAAVWSRCSRASYEQPYIAAKAAHGVPLDDLRVVPDADPLRIAGESMAGALVVPIWRPDGELVSLQFIAPPETARRLRAKGKPTKLNMPGASLDGWHTVGSRKPGDIVYVCEGIGAAWACWKATGSAAVVCFGWGRVKTAATELRRQDPAARVVLVPDVGKETQAAEISRATGADWVAMPEGWPENADVCDLAQRDGFDALEWLLSSPMRPAYRYKLLSGADLAALPPLRWRVRGVLPAEGMAALYGPSASGKSFLALDMAAAIAEGRRWFDCRVMTAPVVYAALEGEAGFRSRVLAWESHHGRSLPDGLQMLLQPFKLTDAKDVRDLAAVVPAGGVVFIDTLNRAAPTADENSSTDMGEILEATKRLQALTGGIVCLVHHTGKDATKGLRGHSSLFAALDAAIEVARDGDRRSWMVAKSKDGQDGDAHPFRLKVETLGTDEYGEPVTSCAVAPDTTTEDVQRVRLPQGGNQKLVLEALRPLFKEGVTGKTGAPPLRRCIELEAAVSAGACKLTCPTDRRATRTREAITGLVARGVLGLHEGWLWLV